MSLALKGKESWIKGKTHSEETKLKLSLVQKGKPKAPFTEEHKQNMSKSKKGKLNGMFGKTSKLKGTKLSEEHKEKIRQSKIKSGYWK